MTTKSGTFEEWIESRITEGYELDEQELFIEEISQEEGCYQRAAAHILEWCEEWKRRMEEILSHSAQETLKPEDLIKDLRKYVRGV